MHSVISACDLVTSKSATVNGFSWQANEKLQRASSFFDHANYFREQATFIKCFADIRRDPDIYEFVIAACMLSRKSLSHLSLDMQEVIIRNLIDFSKLSDPTYIDVLVKRYFLTSGDSLGGTMRNVVGQAAQNILTESIVTRLMERGMNPNRILNRGKKTVAISWFDRMVIFDKKPKFIGKSVDIIVVRGESAKTGSLECAGDYTCCGELKGGIDPAGADEHWKTAKTALERVYSSFKGSHSPNLVFIAAAIEHSMSEEIFSLLQSNWLAGAANINYEQQFHEVVDVIIS